MYIVGGRFANRKLFSLKSAKVRPTTSRLKKSLFDICQFKLEGALFLDLCSGTGAIGLEAISRGVKRAILVDSDREVIRCIKKNITTLRVEEQSEVIGSDAITFLKRCIRERNAFDIIYLDPPYVLGSKEGAEGFSLVEEVINLVDEHELLVKGGLLFVEGNKALEKYAQKWEELRHVKLKNIRRVGESRLAYFMHSGRSSA